MYSKRKETKKLSMRTYVLNLEETETEHETQASE